MQMNFIISRTCWDNAKLQDILGFKMLRVKYNMEVRSVSYFNKSMVFNQSNYVQDKKLSHSLNQFNTINIR